MKSTAATILFLLCCCHGRLLAGERTYSVRIIDNGPSDAPLKASGDIVFHEELFQNAAKLHWDVNVTFTNVSSKTIVAYEAEIDSVPEYGSGMRYVDHTDFFFDPPNMLKEGSQRIRKFDTPYAVGKYNSSAPPVAATAKCTLLFVEFADGSSYGNSEWSKSLPKARRITLLRVQDLSRAYESGGETALKEAFGGALARADDPRPTLDQLRQLEADLKERGPAFVASKMKEFMLVGKERGLTEDN